MQRAEIEAAHEEPADKARSPRGLARGLGEFQRGALLGRHFRGVDDAGEAASSGESFSLHRNVSRICAISREQRAGREMRPGAVRRAARVRRRPCATPRLSA